MEYFKICKHHGGLEESQVMKTVKRGKPYNACRLCLTISRAKSSLKNFGKCINHGILTPDLVKKDGTCRLCHRKTAHKKRDENREWFNKKIAEDRLKNPEKWDEIYKKVYQQQKSKYGSLHSLKKCCDARGITVEEYYRIDELQKSLCAICFQPETRVNGRTKMTQRLVIDHCHKTNKVRGLLCHNCNTAIGKFRDDPIRMYRAIRYIKTKGD